MGGHPFQEISCNLCGKPIDLRADLNADENGHAVHEDCYVKRVTKFPAPATAD
jgi:hypothetical protein